MGEEVSWLWVGMMDELPAEIAYESIVRGERLRQVLPHPSTRNFKNNRDKSKVASQHVIICK